MNTIKSLISVAVLILPISALASGNATDRAEKALLEQVRCRRPPQAGTAITAMLKNRLVKPTGDWADGAAVFAPTKRLRLLGFPIVHIAGWQERKQGGAMPPFRRVPGTAPPNFIDITVKASAAELRRVAIANGVAESQRRERMVEIKDGDTDIVEKPLAGVATITCSAWTYE